MMLWICSLTEWLRRHLRLNLIKSRSGLPRHFFIFSLLLLVLAGVSATAGAAGEDPEAVVSFSLVSEMTEYYLETANVWYQQAGFPEYFGDMALLWTETLKTRAELQGELTRVRPEPAQQLQSLLLQLIQIQPQQPEALLLIGKYHYYYHQKQLALWYFERALAVDPQFDPVLLALADYYLSEGQSEKAFETLKILSTPEAQFRKGVARLQQGRYQLALGYLLQAELPPGVFAVVRQKDLVKALRATAALPQARTAVAAQMPITPAGRILFQELLVSLAWLEGRTGEALKLVKTGQVMFSGYSHWDLYLAGLNGLEVLDGTERARLDSQTRSTLYILQGQRQRKQSSWKEAARSFETAWRLDRCALVAYLEAGSLELARDNDQAAIKLFSAGLEIAPEFIPLLAGRAEAFEKLEYSAEAARDRAVIDRLLQRKPRSVPAVNISYLETGEKYLNFRSQLDRLVGVWYSETGDEWQFTPWGRIALDQKASGVWLLPVGDGLSGEAIYLDLADPLLELAPPVVLNGLFQLQLPAKASMVLAPSYPGNGDASYISEQPSTRYEIAVGLFGSGLQEFCLWYGWEEGLWTSSHWQVNLSPLQTEGDPLRYVLSTGQLLTNRRTIKLRLEAVKSVDSKVMMSIGEKGRMSPWLSFQEEYTYVLSPGDGSKTILGRFFDSNGVFQEVQLQVELDSTRPWLQGFKVRRRWFNRYQIQWRANEPVRAQLRTFSRDGQWRMEEIGEEEGLFTAVITKEIDFCQLVLTDGAGNSLLYTDEGLNQQLQDDEPVRFTPDAGASHTKVRNIRVQATDDTIVWSLSNDLRSWSGWRRGAEVLRWRIGAAPGEQLVYVKYRRMDDAAAAAIRYQVIPVVYDPWLPDILKVAATETAKGYELELSLTEPASLNVQWLSGAGAVREELYREPGYQREYRLTLPTEDMDPGAMIRFILTDRAGNVKERVFSYSELKDK